LTKPLLAFKQVTGLSILLLHITLNLKWSKNVEYWKQRALRAEAKNKGGKTITLGKQSITITQISPPNYARPNG
jgi:hypothetical protein